MGNALQVEQKTKIEAAIATARKRFCEKLEERSDELLDCLEALSKPKTDHEKTMVCLQARAHKIQGLAFMIGFPQIGTLAATLDRHLDLVLTGPRPVEVEYIRQLLNELLDAVDSELSRE